MKKMLFILIGVIALCTGCGKEDCPTPELSSPNGTIEVEETITEEIEYEEILTETFIEEESLQELDYK